MRSDWLDLEWNPRREDYRRFMRRLWIGGLCCVAAAAVYLLVGLT